MTTYTKEDLVKVALDLLAKEYTDDREEHYEDSRNVLSWGMAELLEGIGIPHDQFYLLVSQLPELKEPL